MDVVVEERIDGSTTSCRHGMMLITHKDRISKYKEINKPTKAKEERKPHVLTVRKTYKPSANHPWRRFKINEDIHKKKKRDYH